MESEKYMVVQDQETFQRILKSEEIPERVTNEYHKWCGAYHRCGGSGPIGPIACISILGKLDLIPVHSEPVPEIDFMTLPVESRVYVDMGDGRTGKSGTYLGPVSAGTVSVRFDDDPMVREFAQRHVKLGPTKKIDNIVVQDDAVCVSSVSVEKLGEPLAEFDLAQFNVEDGLKGVEDGALIAVAIPKNPDEDFTPENVEVFEAKFIGVDEGTALVEINGVPVDVPVQDCVSFEMA